MLDGVTGLTPNGPHQTLGNQTLLENLREFMFLTRLHTNLELTPHLTLETEELPSTDKLVQNLPIQKQSRPTGQIPNGLHQTLGNQTLLENQREFMFLTRLHTNLELTPHPTSETEELLSTDKLKPNQPTQKQSGTTGQTLNGPLQTPDNQISTVHQNVSTFLIQSLSNQEPTLHLILATEEPLSTPKPEETTNQKEPTKVSTNSPSPKKTKDGKKAYSEKHSHHKTNLSDNGIHLWLHLVLLYLNGERLMSMLFQLLNKPTLTQLPKQVN